MSKEMKWKSHESPNAKPVTLTQTQVTQSLMWLCAQPDVAKQINKLWKNMPACTAIKKAKQ